MKRFINPDGLIDAIEIGENFITIYINSDEPGLPDSIQQRIMEPFKGYITGHDPDRFHPDGETWRTWAKKYACHFHIGEKIK